MGDFSNLISVNRLSLLSSIKVQFLPFLPHCLVYFHAKLNSQLEASNFFQARFSLEEAEQQFEDRIVGTLTRTLT